jgi:hypothetical protein
VKYEIFKNGCKSLNWLTLCHGIQKSHSVCKFYFHFVRTEVLTVAVMNVAIFWDKVPCSTYVKQHFRGTYYLHLQVKNQQSKKPACLPSHVENAGFLFGWFSTLKMEVICSSKTLLHIQTTWYYIPEDGNIHLYLLITERRFVCTNDSESCVGGIINSWQRHPCQTGQNIRIWESVVPGPLCGLLTLP